jgi:hypothetical protein
LGEGLEFPCFPVDLTRVLCLFWASIPMTRGPRDLTSTSRAVPAGRYEQTAHVNNAPESGRGAGGPWPGAPACPAAWIELRASKQCCSRALHLFRTPAPTRGVRAPSTRRQGGRASEHSERIGDRVRAWAPGFCHSVEGAGSRFGKLQEARHWRVERASGSTRQASTGCAMALGSHQKHSGLLRAWWRLIAHSPRPRS